MSINSMWPIIMLIISAFIGYLFSRRSKQNDMFINQLTNSYENAYFPIYMIMKKIKEEDHESKRLELLEEFIGSYNSHDSAIKSIASTFLLDKFFKLINEYMEFSKQNDESKKNSLWKEFNSFYEIIYNEFWEAHDILYKDYIVSKSLIWKNPFVRLLIETSVLLYNTASFLLYISAFVLYISIWNHFHSLNIIPNWWTLFDSFLLFFVSLMLQGFMMLISSWYLSLRNRRKRDKLLNFIKGKTKNKILNGILKFLLE